ncbi:MAG: hypothetical protein NZO16_00820 [Deltaproteobacteria bacterium]|nr:hypothetical protein [Deltaproteobacteria bacterium]
MKTSRVKFSDAELDLCCEIARRLIEIGQLDKAKKILDGLILHRKDSYLISLRAFLGIARGEYEAVNNEIAEYAKNHPHVPLPLRIYLILAKLLKGDSKEAGELIDDLKRNKIPLDSTEKKALEFVETYYALYRR